jgi:hypothetical protein
MAHLFVVEQEQAVARPGARVVATQGVVQEVVQPPLFLEEHPVSVEEDQEVALPPLFLEQCPSSFPPRTRVPPQVA